MPNRGPLLAQDQDSDDDGYGYEFDTTDATLLFEDGQLASLTVTKSTVTEPDWGSHDPHALRIRPRDNPPWQAQGELKTRIIEGRWHEVKLRIDSPPESVGQLTTARIRFRGEELTVEARELRGVAECAWKGLAEES